MRLRAIKYSGGYVFVNDNAILGESYPQIVLERLTTGEYMPWQIDNPNDIDRNNQSVIVAQWGITNPIPNIPHLNFRIPDRSNIVSIELDENFNVSDILLKIY